MNREATVTYIKQHGILPESKFGQNFLCDEAVIASIIDTAGIKQGDRVLEIGPGIGALTRELSKLDVSLVCVEIDKRLAGLLRDDPEIDAEVIDQDYLKLKDYGAETFDVVISNLPYYVMTDIMKKIFAECVNARKMVYMVEEDALDRIIASSRTKQYGPLSVLCSIYGDLEVVTRVPGTSFVPAPRTTSAVISLEHGSNLYCRDLVVFVDRCFAMRRKKLKASLKCYDAQAIDRAYEELDLNENVRAEELEPEAFLKLYNDIINAKSQRGIL
ncbi:MAG: ribosomal RNA small subunit methyltransferase A [Clostridiales bacterium]|nr:ribosomal RNA small subunit methyltransferase A [Clostridiales bacterium]